MIGTVPETALVSLDYRCALDAAIARCSGLTPRLIFGGTPRLDEEAQQRFPVADGSGGEVTLWIDPSLATWPVQLADISAACEPSGLLVVVASRPLARLLPERRGWRGDPLGLRPRGIVYLLRSLRANGFKILEDHGIHSVKAMALGQLAQGAERVGRLDLGDRLRFAAREAYHAEGVLSPLATVALLVARKVPGR